MTTQYDSTMIWVIFVAAGVVTYLLRLSFYPLIDRLEEVPPRAEGVLRFIPAAVFAALVFPSILTLSFSPETMPHFTYETAKLLAGGLAAVVAWRTGNVVATIVIGMVSLWVVQMVV